MELGHSHGLIGRQRKFKKEPKVSNAQINAYLDNHMDVVEKKSFEGMVAGDPLSQELLKNKIKERELIISLVPNQRVSANSLGTLKKETREVGENLLPKNEISLMDKVAKFLDKTILEF